MEREALARALRRQDQRVYEELMEDYGRLLWTIVSGILSGVGTREDVEEVISDVFWELWRQPEQFDPKRGEIQTLLESRHSPEPSTACGSCAVRLPSLWKRRRRPPAETCGNAFHNEIRFEPSAACCEIQSSRIGKF